MDIKTIIKQERMEAKLIKQEQAYRSQLIEDVKYSATPNFNDDLSYRSRLAYERSITMRIKTAINNEYFLIEIRNIIAEQHELTGFKGASKPYRDYLTNF
jgi:hypothetical protein